MTAKARGTDAANGMMSGVLAQEVKRDPTNDGARLCPLLDRAHHLATIRHVLADSEFDSALNHSFIRQIVGADSIIPATRYRQRALIESVFSATKRKPSARAAGRSSLTQVRQALLLGVTFNLYRFRWCLPCALRLL